MDFDSLLAPCFHRKNPYIDSKSGLHFFIQYSRELSPYERLLTFARYVADEKDDRFRRWHRQPANQAWRGDEETMKQQLFNAAHAEMPCVIVAGGVATLALAEDFASRALDQADGAVVLADDLWSQGVNVDDLDTTIASYRLFPEECRSFTVEKIPTASRNPHRFAFKVTRLAKTAG